MVWLELTPRVFRFSLGTTSSSSVTFRNPGMTTFFRPFTIGVTSPISSPDSRLFFPGDGEGSAILRELVGEIKIEAGSGSGEVHQSGSGLL